MNVSIGRIVLAAIDLDGTPGAGCTVGGPGPFPTAPTEFAISGVGFSGLEGAEVVVRFTAVGGARPFLAGTSMTVDEVGIIVSDTLICGETPPAVVCGVATIEATIEVILPTFVRDDSTAATLGPAFTITFAAPTITMFDPACVPSLTPVPFTITGTAFGDDGDTVTVRFSSAEDLPAGDPIFADGTSTQIDVTGTIAGGGTMITGTTPKATNQVEGSPPGPANPLHRVSDPLEDAAIDIILSNGSCTSGAGTGSTQFDAPEGDTITAPGLAVATSVPQTIATPFVITGTIPAACPDGFGPIGGTVQISFSAPGNPSVPTGVFRLDASGVGTEDFDIVEAEIISATEIRGLTPIVRARDDFLPVVRIHFEDGTIAPITVPFAWEAPPVIDTVTNLDAAAGTGTLQGLAPGEFSGCHSTTMSLVGVNFDNPGAAGTPVVILYDKATGISRRLGTANPVGVPAGNDLGPVFTTSATTITGETRIDGLLGSLDTDGDGAVTVVVRVTAADGQFGEADVIWRTSTDAFNRTNSGAEINSNVSVTIDPTSMTGGANTPPVPHDFGQSTNDATFGSNMAAAFENDTSDQSATNSFSGTSLFLDYSRDGGLTWTRTTIDGTLDGQPAAAVRSFPQTRYDRFGNLWLSYLLDDFTGAAGTEISRIMLFVSFDQGATFATGGALYSTAIGDGGLLFEPGMATGLGTSPANSEVAMVSWVDGTAGLPDQIRMAIGQSTGFGNGSLPGGSLQVDTVAPGPNVLFRAHATPAVGPGGEWYVSWVEPDFTNFPPVSDIRINVNADGDLAGAFFGDDQLVAENIEFPLGPPPSQPDAGRLIPLQDMEVIQGGQHAGRVIIAYESTSISSGLINPTYLSVVTTYSDDFGQSWDDEVAHQADTSDQFLPALAVDPISNNVYLTWHDTRNSAPINHTSQRFAASSAHGTGWGVPLLLSSGASAHAAGDEENVEYGVWAGLAVWNGCILAGWADTADNTAESDAVLKLFQMLVK